MKNSNCYANLYFSDIFVSKFAYNGYLVWSKIFGTVVNDYGQSIALDLIGNLVYITGMTTGTLSDPQNAQAKDQSTVLASLSMSDGFIQTFNQWQHSGFNFGLGVVVDDLTGYVYVMGTFSGQLQNVTTKGASDMYLMTFDYNGYLLETNIYGTPYSEQICGTVFDSEGFILYIVGTSFYYPFIARYDILTSRPIRPQIYASMVARIAQSVVVPLFIIGVLFGLYFFYKRLQRPGIFFVLIKT